MWKNLNINKNSIEYSTASAVLIKMPNKSEYKDFKFWHPAKLVRNGRHNSAISIGYTNEFTFKLFRTNKKGEKLAEKEISAKEFEQAFSIIDENITSKKHENPYETHQPTKITEDTRVEVEESLLDE